MAGRIVTLAPVGAMAVAAAVASVVVSTAPVVSIVMVLSEKLPAAVSSLDTLAAISTALPSKVTWPPLVIMPASPIGPTTGGPTAPPNCKVRSLIDSPRAAAAHTLFGPVSPGALPVTLMARPLVVSPKSPIWFPTWA